MACKDGSEGHDHDHKCDEDKCKCCCCCCDATFVAIVVAVSLPKLLAAEGDSRRPELRGSSGSGSGSRVSC